MKLSTYIEDEVYKLLSSVDVPKEKGDKPDKEDYEKYISINTLGLPAGVYQDSYFNVNCHAKDGTIGKAKRSILNPMANSVLGILERKYLNPDETTSIFIEFDSSETIREEKLKGHYINLRFKVTIINK